MPDQKHRIDRAVEIAMANISTQIARYDEGGMDGEHELLNRIQQQIYTVLHSIGIDQTADPAPSAESVGRAMLALPHLPAHDVLAVARLIDDARGATPYDQAQAWAAETTKIHAMYAGDIKALQEKLQEAMRHGEHGEAARWKALFEDRGETIAAWQRHADHLRAELLKAQGEAQGQIGFSEDKQRSIIMAGERVTQAAGKLDSLYSTCIQLVENMAPNVMPVVEAVQMLIDRDARHEQGVRNLQALGASLAEIDDYESRAFDVASQVKKLGWTLDYITIAAFDKPEPQEAEHAGVYGASDVRVALASLIDQWGLNNLANQFNMLPKELQGIVYGDDSIPERIARKAGFESDGQNWRKITYE